MDEFALHIQPYLIMQRDHALEMIDRSAKPNPTSQLDSALVWLSLWLVLRI